MTRRVIIFLFFCLICSVCSSGLHFEHLTINDGLSQNLVYAILQDHKGFMWFGTSDGLNRYDGYQFTVFRHNPFDSTSVSGPVIPALFEDRDGTLWIGAKGLNRFDRQTETFIRYLHDPAAPQSISHNDVYAITEDQTGALWVGTGQGLNRLLPDRNGRFIRYRHDPANPNSLSDDHIRILLVDDQGTLWIGTMNGLNALPNDNTACFFHHHFDNTVITALYKDSKGNVWVGTPAALYRLDRLNGEATFQTFALAAQTRQLDWQGSIMAICERPDRKLWLGTLLGLALFDPHAAEAQFIRHDAFDPHSISFDAVISICRDRGGCFWFGTPGKGLDKLAPITKKFHHYGGKQHHLFGQSELSIKAILEDRTGHLWVAANDRLYQIDRTTDRWHWFRGISFPVGTIAEDAPGCLWFEADRGFSVLDPRTGQIKRISFVPRHHQSVMLSTPDGVWEHLPNISGLLIAAGVPNADNLIVFRAVQQTDDLIWLTTDAGLIRLNPMDSSAHVYRNDPANPSSLSYDVIYAILPDPLEPARFLWLGTAGGGLNCLDMTTETFTHYTEKDGLPNNVVYGILSDDHGRLWMSINRGLSRFDPVSKTCRNYDVRDGLQSNEFNRNAYFKSRKGEMFFGGINGLNVFHPDSIRDNPHAPSVVMTDFYINYQSVSFRDPRSPLQKPVSETDEIRLAHFQNTIAFEFAALDFTAPEKNRYAYKLENLDQQWVQAGTRRRATYTSLSPGTYVFRVKGANNDGVWHETGTSIRLVINPPVWKTWWAYTVYVLFMIAAVIGFVQYRVRHLQKRARELESAVQERTAEVVAHEKQLALQAEKLRELDHIKSGFFANISHEFRTPLTLILAPVKRLISEITQDNIKQELRLIHKNGQRLLRLVNQLLDLSRLETGKMTMQVRRGNIVALVREITMSFASLAEQKNISLQFRCETEEILLYFDKDKIEKIFYNLLSNAFKFTEKGSVQVSVQRVREDAPDKSAAQDHCFVDIAVSDTGIGIRPDLLPHIFNRFYQGDVSSTREHEGAGIGLSLVKELVELHRGEVSVASVDGQGSTFTVRLPMSKEVFGAEELSETLALSDDLINLEDSDTVSGARPESMAEFDTIILVVEDHADVRTLIRDYLQDEYRTVEAANGVEGLEKAREIIPDLILGDVMMPRMNGYDMCRALKEDERTSHIPVILLTARAALEDKVTGLKTGADDYLTKPFESEELLARVQNLIRSRRTLRERWKTTVVLKPNEMAATPLDQAFLEKALAIVEERLDDEAFSIEEFACRMGMSRSQLHRKLHALTNQSASLFLRSVRLLRAADLLRSHAGSVGEIAYRVGFGSQAYFTRCFQEQFGCSPKEFADKTD
ncbi:response regulator [candidate division KSB1 bacterium]|nr:response regulator [candidate division KSB1 bacterium]